MRDPVSRISLPVAAGLVAVISCPVLAAPAAHEVGGGSAVAQRIALSVPSLQKIDATKAALRSLWIGHIFWVRNVVVAALAGNGAAEQAAEKEVVANAQQIAGAIEPFYGAAAKDKLFQLLAGHYGAVKAYLEASIAGDAGKQSEATNKLLANAEEIATFLSGANPNLPKDELLGMLQAHGGQHLTQIQKLQAKDYAAEAQNWAEMAQHVYMIADALTDAIAKQFPKQF